MAAATPRLHLAQPAANAAAALDMLAQAEQLGCDLVVFPELSLTGYTCGDLFQQETLLDAAETALRRLLEESPALYRGVLTVGLPVTVHDRLYNVVAVIHQGRLLGLVPKTHLPTYNEFYERRWFTPYSGDERYEATFAGQTALFTSNVVFMADDIPGLGIGLEICEDLWVPSPPGNRLAQSGATLLVNPSASNEGVGKADYRRQLVSQQSARCLSAYIYAASGVGESTTDLVFGGHSMIAENGAILAENPRFQREGSLTVADIDLERLLHDRRRVGTFTERPLHADDPRDTHMVTFTLGPPRGESAKPEAAPRRVIPAQPFVPHDPRELSVRCEEIFQTQMAGLAGRLEAARTERVVIGVSGGLDSTLALLVVTRAFDLLGWNRDRIRGVTMPGFGTSDQTRDNAEQLMELLGVPAQRIDIRQLAFDHFLALRHHPFGIDPNGHTVETFQPLLRDLAADNRHDLVFENVQARTRTMILMNMGFVIGTGDLSELALGWCTYNADHMSMYNPNAGIPKTLVRFLVTWAADNEFDGRARQVLHAIAGTEISPELLPVGSDGKIQSTESTIGPYELHDFFLYHMIRFGYGPAKLLRFARHAAFERQYSPDDMKRWLRVFLKRFFASQFKRSCVPDGPKVGSISLSPRGDWRMPSDAQGTAWLDELDRI